MSIQPEGEKLRNAVRMISEKRKENPEADPAKLVDEVSFQFDLSPKDTEFLLRFIKDADSPDPA